LSLAAAAAAAAVAHGWCSSLDGQKKSRKWLRCVDTGGFASNVCFFWAGWGQGWTHFWSSYDPKNGASCIVHIGLVNELCDTIFILWLLLP
jgi:hypothetical protein